MNKIEIQKRKIMSKLISIVIVAIFVSSALMAAPKTYVIEPIKKNIVQFTSEARVEKIVGTTNQIVGELKVDPNDLSQPISAWFEVDAASINTKNKIRNGHMRDNHLHTGKYPKIRFDLKSVEGLSGKFTNDQKVNFKVTGDFHLHGVTKSIQPAITANYLVAEDTFEIIAKFQVPLSDYEIPLPKFLVLKVSNIHEIKVKFQATAK